ncbi:MAG TPA: AAA family ATPase, partial [Gammaproteobacteria bacterium]|nr:AAA family ATPase [Gammaproteobacteria bacterium]
AARNSWEVTQVNELLTRMEEFDGLFICSTNLIESLDEASIRRFDLKIRFDYLTPEHAWILFRQTLSDQGTAESPRAPHRERLSRLPNLTPGDFATAIRQNRLTGEPLTPSRLLERLERESRFKNRRHSRGIGFCADI